MMHKWLVRNDEKRYYIVVSAKNVYTLRRRLNERKETVIGREDKLPVEYRAIFEAIR